MSFLKSTFVVGFCTLISRITGFIRDIFFAKYLGTGMLSDVFLTSFKLPNFFRNIFAEGAFNAAFVPIFSSQLVKNNKNEIVNFSRNIFSLLIYSLLIIILVIEIFMSQVVNVVASGFSGNYEKFNLTVILSRIMFPYLIFISLVSFMSGILNSYGKFAIVSVHPIILNVVFMIFSVLSTYTHKNIAFILSFSVLIGGFLQFAWLLFFTVKNGITLYPIYPKIDENTKNFLKNFLSGLIGSGIVQINMLIGSIMASKISSAVSYLYYSERLVQLPISLIGTALSTTIMPLLSKKIEAKNKDVNDILENSILFALFLGLPCAIGLNLLSYPIISVLFKRGKFTQLASQNVSNCLKFYSLAIPGFIISKILQTIFYSNKDTKTPMIASFISLITNIIFNLIFIHYFNFIGIIVSTVISTYVNLVILLYLLLKSDKLKFTTKFYVVFAKIIYISIFMFISLIICNKYLLYSESIKLFLSILVSGLIYLGIAYKIKVLNFVEFL